MNPLESTYGQILTQFADRYSRGAFHAAAFYRAFYEQPHIDLDQVPAFRASPHLAADVQRDLATYLPPVVSQMQEEGVVKLAFRLIDGAIVESVIIPMPQHTTVCVSSQVGCRMGCRICETGRMGLHRQLSVGEIVAQVHAAKVRLGLDVRNVVFMGMGEPLDNFEAVVQAISVIEDQRGLNIAKRRMTLSTCGLADGIQRLAGLNWPQLKLAVSLNAADDTTRSAIMPVNRRFDLATLKAALVDYPLSRGNAVLFEYVLIKDVNDSPADARHLARYLNGLVARLNLIAYNPGRHSSFEAPSPAALHRFRQALIDLNLFVRVRHSKGARIQAACGQLGARPDLDCVRHDGEGAL